MPPHHSWLRHTLCLCAVVLLTTYHADAAGASVSLRARWQGTPYLLEAAEFMADESPQLYWQFLDSLDLTSAATDAAADDSSSSSSACWHSLIDQASALCLPQVAKILPVVVGVRQYSARLEMFRQLTTQLDPAQEHCCFVDVHGTIVTDATKLQAAISAAAKQQTSSNSSLQLLEADHVLNPEKQDAPGAILAVLHAAPGTDCWTAMHSTLKQAVQDAPASSPVVYAHRPVLSPACKSVHPCSTLGSEEQLVLPGYGVEAVLKNMEYSAIDDKAKADAAAAAAKKAAQKGKAGSAGNDDLSDIGVSSLGEVKGFKFDVLAQRKPHLVQELMTFRDVLMSNDEEEAIKVWDLKDAGLQAASRVAAASDPLSLLAEISQNFISLVSSLTRQKVSDRMRNTVASNQRYISPGANFMLLNGMLVEVKNFEIYSFLDRLRIELRLQGQLQSLGLKPGLVQQLLKQRATGNAEVNELRLDLSPMKQIAWLNNPEKDKEYAHLPGDMTHILQMYPGRLSAMAANLFFLTVIGDPLSPEAVNMAKIMTTVKARQLPIRLGALLLVPQAVARAEAQRSSTGQTIDMPTWKEMSAQERFARGFLTLKSSLGAGAAWDFWQRLAEPKAAATLAKNNDKAVQKLLKTSFSEAWTAAAATASTKRAKQAAKKTPVQAWDDLMSGSGYSSEVGMQLSDMSNYLITKGLGHLHKPMWWLNGLINEVPEGGQTVLDQAVGMGIMHEMRGLQEHIYFGRMDDEQSVVESLLEMHQSVRRWNPRILALDEDADADSQKLVLVDAVQHPGAQALTYLHSKGTEARVKAATHWVVTDLSTSRGRGLASAALNYLSGDDEELEPDASRAALILAPGQNASVLDVAVVAAQKAFAKDAKLLQLLKALITQQSQLAATPATQLTADMVQQLQQVVQEAEVKSPEAFKLDADQVAEAQSLLGNSTSLVLQQLQLPAKSCAVITNGRAIWVFDPRTPDTPPPELIAEDFGLLQLYAESFQAGGGLATYLKSYRSATKKKAKEAGGSATESETMSAANASTVVMVTASALAAQVYPDSKFGSLHAKQLTEVLGSLSDWAVVTVGPPADDADLQLTAILNPLTREAQRLSQVLLLLKDVLNPSVRLYLNPQTELSELPLKSYYRYALPDFQHDEQGRIRLPGAPSAYFPRLPQKRVLTLNLELPESWLVEPVMALHDLDNLRLADIPEQVAYAEYELDAIMLTGSCTEFAPGKQLPPPKGLELHLGTEQEPHMVDTLVMQNLGYFQLKASPGLWELSIAPGRSRDLYQINSVTSGSAISSGWGWGRRSAGGTGTEQGATGHDYSAQVLLHSFTGKHLLLKVQKRAGKESESLLPAADAAAANGKGGKAVKKDYGTINVFTVASGHMYERLQKIMILSVIKNTKSKVKFWIISNYMSPHHKRIIPAMAEKYGFDYEFVTYKWPHWLHKQTDKQRIIWAYKILFLDVLFPLDVPRMIFVDSDQVVRTDLAKLYNMDLKGAPYAYTPFCDTNKETEPYRFWKTGFWQQHLGGKPYHISALYLIDLERFRQLSAGDQLRVIYENLSKDPNSLANLDQDLPNYAQHQLPIFSLPQEWLWCESWCGNSTKSKAHTIDLCNNPKTKEPKLQAARRIIKEWPGLDDEQAKFTDSVDAQFKAQEQEFAAGAGAAAATASSAGGGTDADADDASDRTEL